MQFRCNDSGMVFTDIEIDIGKKTLTINSVMQHSVLVK